MQGKKTRGFFLKKKKKPEESFSGDNSFYIEHPMKMAHISLLNGKIFESEAIPSQPSCMRSNLYDCTVEHLFDVNIRRQFIYIRCCNGEMGVTYNFSQ